MITQTFKNRNIEGILLPVLCFIGLLGYILPFISVNINILKYSYSKDVNLFNLFSFFNRSGQAGDKQFGGLGSSLADVLGLRDNDMLTGIAVKFILSVGSYVATLLLLIIVFVCLLTGALKKASTIMLAVSFVLYIYSGYTISKLPAELFDNIESKLGFLGSLLHLSDMVKISLGTGYWVTVIAIGCTLVIKAMRKASIGAFSK